MGILTLVFAASCALVCAQYPPPVWVGCSSTQGSFRVRLYPEWAPTGVDRFLELVDSGFFNSVPFFRVVQGFVAQFGVHTDTSVSAAWNEKGKILDDPNLGIAWKKGMLSFAGSGPDSRGTQMFFGFEDDQRLGKQRWETPLGFVDHGFEVIERVYAGYGDLKVFGGEAPDGFRIMQEGGAFLREEYPLMDYITGCARINPLAPSPTSTPAPRPTPQPTPPPTLPTITCTDTACGTAFAADPRGLLIICSCHADCVDDANCCDGFEEFCPVEPAVDCKPEQCGGSLSLDPTGADILCSCHFSCMAKGNCCGSFEQVCPEQMGLLDQRNANAKLDCEKTLDPVLNDDCPKKVPSFVIRGGKCVRVETCRKQAKATKMFSKLAPCRSFRKKCVASGVYN